MKKKFLALILAFCLTALCACANEPVFEEDPVVDNAGLRATLIYFLSADGQIVPVMKLLPWQEGIGKAALECLVANEDNNAAASAMGLYPTIPEGVSFSLKIDEKENAELDITNLPKLNSETDERNMLVSIVNTLVSFPTIKTVSITLDGKKIKKLPHGTPVSNNMLAYSLNVENGDISVDVGDAAKLTLYFPNQRGSLFVPVTRIVKGSPTFELAVNEFLKGPSDKALTNCLSEGVELVSATIVDDIATVNLNSIALALKTDQTGRLPALYNALYLIAGEFGAVAELKLFAGETLLYENTENVSAPLYPNEFTPNR
ncbi:MAG: GerMN domain-containing protein [Clostridia bacterium]